MFFYAVHVALAQDVPNTVEVAEGAPASGPAADQLPPELQALLDLQASLTYTTGDITLGGGKAMLHLPPTFGYLDPAETDKVLQAWGNPPSPNTWGMLVPDSAPIFADGTWAVVLSYADDGHVDDADAAEIDYAQVLKDMQSDAAAENAERAKAGFSTVNVVGWAEAPHYDAVAHKIYWAKELDFGDGDHTLNYAIRALGRDGVLEFNAVASMSQLAEVKAPMEEVLGFSEFTAGSRYEDFNGATDRVAEYGLAALVAGGVAAKSGFFKGLIVALLAGKKFVVMALVALGAFFKNLYTKRSAQGGAPPVA